jgi:hypothetical protein
VTAEQSALHGGMEWSVKNVPVGSHFGLPASDESLADTSPGFLTPTEFMVQVGRVLAVCLGLAILAHVVVVMVGAH